MLSYQHMYHAGYLSDVHKHFCLSVLLQHFTAQDGELDYIETHAGRGLYNLKSREALKTGEAKLGIETIQSSAMLDQHHIYTQILHRVKQQYGKHYYPGSPLIAQHILRQKDHLHLFELHPQEHLMLEKYITGENVTITRQDGYDGARAIKNNASKKFILIDPSYELKPEYQQIVTFCDNIISAWNDATILLWYPILAANTHISMCEQLHHHFKDAFWQQNITFPPSKRKRALGSGLILINPPPTLNDALDKVKRILL